MDWMKVVKFAFLILGVFYLYGLFTRLPVFFNNPKARSFTKLLGLKGYKLFLFIIGIVFILLGLLL